MYSHSESTPLKQWVGSGSQCKRWHSGDHGSDIMGRGLVARQRRLVGLEAVAEKARKARYLMLQCGLVSRSQVDIVNGFGIQ